MKIYTRTGDDGTTSLSGGERVSKSHGRVEAGGSLDELVSWVGLLRDFSENDDRREILLYIQEQLMRCSATLASESGTLEKYLPQSDCILKLENKIDLMEAKLPSLKNFVIPGGHVLVSYCHIARCVCRRTERVLIKLNETENIPDILYKFLNRLSDYLFILSRFISLELDIQENTWYL